MNKQALKELKQAITDIIAVLETSFKETPQDNSFDEAMQLIYYAAKADAVKPLSFTRARFIDLLCKEPDFVQGISFTLLKYCDNPVIETELSLNNHLNNK